MLAALVRLQLQQQVQVQARMLATVPTRRLGRGNKLHASRLNKYKRSRKDGFEAARREWGNGRVPPPHAARYEGGVFAFSPQFGYKRKEKEVVHRPQKLRPPIFKAVVDPSAAPSSPSPPPRPAAAGEAEEELDPTPCSQAFSRLGVPHLLAMELSKRGYDRPTPIQEQAVPPLLKGASALMTAETGAGKTLAFLLPLAIRMKAHEADPSREQNAHIQGPRVVVLAPTRELALQLFLEAKQLSHVLKFRVRLWSNQKTKYPDSLVPDMVVSTPYAFARDMRWPAKAIQSLVLDECDAMLFMDSGFNTELNHLARAVDVNTCQIICVGATALKGDSLRWLKTFRPHAAVFKTDRTHSIPPNISFDISHSTPSEGLDKHPALDRAVNPVVHGWDRQHHHHGARPAPPKCIVFCNSIASTRSTHHFLSARYGDDAEVCSLHGDMRPKQRDENFLRFSSTDAETENADARPRPKILVCTDLSGRGIDVSGVDTVIIFDIPERVPDFLHRAGRTGRAGKQGKVVFVLGRGEREDVRKLFPQSLSNKDANVFSTKSSSFRTPTRL